MSADWNQVFLVDNSTSMRNYWDKLVPLFDVLAYIVKGSDPDGLELYFTSSDCKCKDKNTTALVVTTRGQCAPTSPQLETNIHTSLDSVLRDYLKKLNSHLQPRHTFSWTPRDVRKLSLYILTDGQWQPESDAESPIRLLVETLDELRKPKDQVGIQFIQFGTESSGTAILNYLDSGLKLTR